MSRSLSKKFRPLVSSVVLLVAVACSPIYYSTLESFGIEKRQILVDRVEDARDAQEDAKEQFSSALEQFQVLMGFDGGELERVYDKLKSELEDSEARAGEVRDRVESVETVADDLFTEWQEELGQYTDPKLRRQSETQLNSTRRRYQQLEAAMHRSVAKMDPVLDAFRDQVLFLKHNLNAQAIGSLKGQVDDLEVDVSRLIADMEASIAEANAFVESMNA